MVTKQEKKVQSRLMHREILRGAVRTEE